MSAQQAEHWLPLDRYRQYKRAQAIKERHADGERLTGHDLAFMLGLQRQHPHAQAKIGSGVDAILVHRYIGGSRCFFILRQDGSLEDFSVRKCLGLELRRTSRVREMMRLSDFTVVARAYWRFAARRDRGTRARRDARQSWQADESIAGKGAEYDPSAFSGWPKSPRPPWSLGVPAR